MHMAEHSPPVSRSIGTFTFSHSGESTSVNELGMREMQARAYAKRTSRLLLIKAPPACGKSRALMYLALDKLRHQGLEKVIIAVPQMVIGSSFKDTDLTSGGFFEDWHIDEGYNLCTPGGESGKAERVLQFMHDPDARCLLCAHPTLVAFHKNLSDVSLLNRTLVAIDEFHHVSADEGNQLGNVIRSLIADSKAHLVAMTGSYFRGDSVPILSSEDERLFDTVTYTYYEQLNGYRYLKSLGINYAFYKGKWTDALPEVLDTGKKTLIHIPPTNSREATGDKTNEVGAVLDAIGRMNYLDEDTGVYTVTREDGRAVRVADLVTPAVQYKALDYLRKIRERDDIDIIIAMGMAKEGFDWPWCEHVLTVAYRSSLTEVVQIIGRATRDCKGKEHAQFTNLIRRPAGTKSDIGDGVNALLKAIVLSLLMEQVLTPNVHFRVRGEEVGPGGGGKQMVIDDERLDALSEPAKAILDHLGEITEDLLTSGHTGILFNEVMDPGEEVSGEFRKEIETRLMQRDPGLSGDDMVTLTDCVIKAMEVKAMEAARQSTLGAAAGRAQGGEGSGGADVRTEGVIYEEDEGGEELEGNDALLRNRSNYNVDSLRLDLIASIHPFAGFYDFISRDFTQKEMETILNYVRSQREPMSMREALELWPHINNFISKHKRDPDPNARRDDERRFAVALAYIRKKVAEQRRDYPEEAAAADGGAHA